MFYCLSQRVCLIHVIISVAGWSLLERPVQVAHNMSGPKAVYRGKVGWMLYSCVGADMHGRTVNVVLACRSLDYQRSRLKQLSALPYQDVHDSRTT